MKTIALVVGGLESLLRSRGYCPLLSHRTAVTSILALLMLMGITTARIARDTFFLGAASASDMPGMYVYIAAMMLILSALYTRLTVRTAPRILCARLQSLINFSLLALWLVAQFLLPKSRYGAYVVFCVVECLALLMTLQLWATVSSYFTSDEGKTSFPIVGAAGLLGTLLGGLTAPGLSNLVGPTTLFLVWPLVGGGCLALLRTATTKSKGPEDPSPSNSTTAQGREARTAQPIRSGPKSALSIPLVRTLAYMTIPLWSVVYIVEWTYFGTMDRAFPDPVRLASALGWIVSLSAFLGLTIQLLALPTLLRALGVGGTVLLYPLSLLVATALLLTFSLLDNAGRDALPLFGIAILVVTARLCDIAVYFSVYESSEQLLYYALPAEIRDQTRVMQSGRVVPVGMALAGCLLLFFNGSITGQSQPNYATAYVALALAFQLVIFGLNVTPDYLRSRVAHLDLSDSSQVALIHEELASLSVAETRYVLIDSLTSKNHKETEFAASLLFSQGDSTSARWAEDDSDLDSLYADVGEILPIMSRAGLSALARCLEHNSDPLALSFRAAVERHLGKHQT